MSLFSRTLQSGDVAFLHFSGHGVALDGENYLLPADVPSPATADKELLKSSGFALSSVIERLRAPKTSAQILIIDACRDNPYAKNISRAITVEGGLVEPPRQPSGTFIIFSAGIGQTAADRLSDSDPEPTSVFMRQLLARMAVQGKTLIDLVHEVREDVEAVSSKMRPPHEQRPAYYDEIDGNFYFVPPGGNVATVVPPQPQPAAGRLRRGLCLSLPRRRRSRCRSRSHSRASIAGPCATPTKWRSAATPRSPRSIAACRVSITALPTGCRPTRASRCAARRATGSPAAAPASMRCLASHKPTTPASPTTATASGGYTPPPAPAPMPPVVVRPSFDCRSAKQPDEIAVCNDATLAAKDVALTNLYNRLKASLNADGQRQLSAYEAVWLKSRAQCGSLASCIGQQYDLRIRQLQDQLAGR